MNNAIETVTRRGCTAALYQDVDPVAPNDWTDIEYRECFAREMERIALYSCFLRAGNGYIYIPDTMENNAKYPDENAVKQELRLNLSAWKQYLTAEVYGYSITDPNGVVIDSLWGLYGLEYALGEMEAALDDAVAPEPLVMPVSTLTLDALGQFRVATEDAERASEIISKAASGRLNITVEECYHGDESL